MISSDNIPLLYVDCDIPAGVTLTDWRREKVAAERRSRADARAARAAQRTAVLKGLLPRLAPRPSLRPRLV